MRTRSSVLSEAGCRTLLDRGDDLGRQQSKEQPGPGEALTDVLGPCDCCDRDAGPDLIHPGQGARDGAAEHAIDRRPFVIAEASRIFGFDAWDRQTLSTECLWQSAAHQRNHACSYIARVRITVRAGDVVVCREASGSGHGIGATPGAAHESAIKEAAADAMKRALITFGNPFGLALYDPELQGVRGGGRRIPDRHAVSWAVLAPDGGVLATYADSLDFCAALRRQLQELDDPRALGALWARHAAALEMLRLNFPELRSHQGIHWADVLLASAVRSSRSWPARSNHQLRFASPQATQAPMQSQRHPSRGAFATRSTSGS